MRGLNRLGALLAGTAAAAWIMVAVSAAQTATLPPETPSHQTVPEAGGSGSSSEPLSDKLNQQNGVIIPPAHIDPGLAQTPPGLGKTPVIAPPGSSAGDLGTNPK